MLEVYKAVHTGSTPIRFHCRRRDNAEFEGEVNKNKCESTELRFSCTCYASGAFTVACNTPEVVAYCLDEGHSKKCPKFHARKKRLMEQHNNDENAIFWPVAVVTIVWRPARRAQLGVSPAATAERSAGEERHTVPTHMEQVCRASFAQGPPLKSVQRDLLLAGQRDCICGSSNCILSGRTAITNVARRSPSTVAVGRPKDVVMAVLVLLLLRVLRHIPHRHSTDPPAPARVPAQLSTPPRLSPPRPWMQRCATLRAGRGRVRERPYRGHVSASQTDRRSPICRHRWDGCG
ncbi:unnamed protein product [Vitrella brassicaformis CCMP3155]|uniref:Uncharacterized protein n=1 Tax=Vitrella brassicaformis (strain CCMP3155) TaxID=1169540 RepID=A0A0G4FTJ7_VITBC|nr:unnamed protein product [Vitrella brassicaformis CCMP3155]|eukprot:CEM18265.1 unnamed protein product [Vitrella brassicaformis CCMP3155]